MVMSQSAPSQQQQSISPRGSTTPLISSAQRDAAAAQEEHTVDGVAEDKDPRSGKRRFFGLGKKKEEKVAPLPQTTPTIMASASASAVPVPPPQHDAQSSSPPALGGPALKPQGPAQAQPIPISPSRTTYPANLGASPSRLRSASPRRHSPASSEIFERNVQEPAQIVQLQGELSPAHIPAHVITEDHIPPALEASAQAITSEELNPDEVEIVMSTAHQPAASVLEGSTSHADLTQLNSPLTPLQSVRSEESGPASSIQQSGVPPSTAEEDGASNYGQLDPTDVRRLSFISFADVVQSEHHGPPPSGLSDMGSRDNLHVSPSSQQRATMRPNTTSNSGGVTTPPPPGVNVTSSDLEHSPPPSSVNLANPASPHHGELTIETMRQAVRKTASGDLSAVRSAGMSPVSDEHLPSAPRSRTNS